MIFMLYLETQKPLKAPDDPNEGFSITIPYIKSQENTSNPNTSFTRV